MRSPFASPARSSRPCLERASSRSAGTDARRPAPQNLGANTARNLRTRARRTGSGSCQNNACACARSASRCRWGSSRSHRPRYIGFSPLLSTNRKRAGFAAIPGSRPPLRYSKGIPCRAWLKRRSRRWCACGNHLDTHRSRECHVITTSAPPRSRGPEKRSSERDAKVGFAVLRRNTLPTRSYSRLRNMRPCARSISAAIFRPLRRRS
jgi:hypothetical protein